MFSFCFAIFVLMSTSPVFLFWNFWAPGVLFIASLYVIVLYYGATFSTKQYRENNMWSDLKVTDLTAHSRAASPTDSVDSTCDDSARFSDLTASDVSVKDVEFLSKASPPGTEGKDSAFSKFDNKSKIE